MSNTTTNPAEPPPISENLVGKVAIVTGAGTRPGEGVGNGRAAAILLARAGCKVVCADIVGEWVEGTKRMIEEQGGEAVVVLADVSKQGDCEKIVKTAMEKYGRLDVLVNNVGVAGPKGTAETVDLEEWNRGLLINVTSMMLMAKYAVPAMRSTGNGGSIVNIASVAGLRGGHPHLLYPVSKGAVVQMTRAMAVQHAGDKIRVNCVCPGMVFTPMVQEGGMTPAMRDQRRRRSILQTEGSGWDVGAAVLFFAGGLSRWQTGVVLPVDAGATAVTALPGAPANASESSSSGGAGAN